MNHPLTTKETIIRTHKNGGLYIDELLDELAITTDDEVILRHPMTLGETVGRIPTEELTAAAESIFTKIEPSHAWRDTNISGREWHAYFIDHHIRGVTVAQRDGKRVQVDIFLSTFPAPVRQALYNVSKDLISTDAWSLPADADTSLPPIAADEELNAKLPFGLSSDVILTSPVACKPVSGIDDVERLCGHSVIVYGGRANGPRLTTGATTLSLWTGSVAGLPLEVANIIHWEDAQHVKVMAMAMRPWPVVALFKARMQARTLSFLDASYFESDDTSPHSHLEK